MVSVHVSFRARIWLALVGCVALLLVLTLLVVRRETGRQVALFEAQNTERARAGFEQLEQLWRDQLAQLGLRLITSARIQAALVEGDPALLGDVAVDELVLAGIPDALAVFMDLDGVPLATLLDGAVLHDGAERVAVESWIDRLLADEPAGTFGYDVVSGRLFAIQATVLTLFDRPLGALLLGFPVQDADARRLADVIEAEICFAVAGACVAATPGVRGTRLEALLVRAASSGGLRTALVDRERRALIPQPLSAASGASAWRVLALPLDGVLAPFERIRRVATMAGLVALLAATLLALFLSRSLTRPVQRLVEATRRIGRGEYEVHVAGEGRDEIGTLAAAFNSMAAGLRLKERYRGILDKVVSPEVAEELMKGEIRLGGETREVTTLFADIRGFTSYTEGMEPQAVVAMLNEFLTHATTAVEAAGGVVDKYVGDGLVALFGAPVAGPEDPQRAVEAALAIRRAVAALNAARELRGEARLEVGIGINTGLAVAGNMGSARRLNYTVIGEAVNVAARLCGAAGPGEILISEATHARVSGQVTAHRLSPLRVRGLSYEVQVYAVDEATTGRAGAGLQRAAAAGVPAVVVMAALLTSAAAAHAQGIRGPAGTQWQVDLGARVELEGYVPQQRPAWLIEETKPFLAGRASGFGLLAVGERVSALVEVRADRGQVPADAALQVRLQQAFLHLLAGTPLQLAGQAGRFTSPFGMYTQRHRTPADPFVRPPLTHDYRTTVSAVKVPAGIDGFLGWKDEPLATRQRGAPPVWAVPYPTGVMLTARPARADVRVAVVTSAPASAPREWVPDVDGALLPSLIVNAGWQLRPELRLGASVSTGPYLEPVLDDSVPAGTRRRDFAQRIWNANLAFARGRVEGHAEVFLNRWDVPNLADAPQDLSWYAEGKLKLAAGTYVAGRYNAIHFNRMSRTTGEREPWDHDVSRWQFAGGYRLARGAELRAEYLVNRGRAAGTGGDNLVALQFWWAR